jgi:hypothetical protein
MKKRLEGYNPRELCIAGTAFGADIRDGYSANRFREKFGLTSREEDVGCLVKVRIL